MPAVPTRDPVVGQIIAGRYQALVRIGEGAVGVVYKARHVVLGRLVAIKLVRAELAADPTWVQGLFAASAAASQIGDPHIGAVLDHGLTADNHPFLVAELLEGRSLRDELGREPVMAPARAARILRQVCSALASAHAAGVLHRDLKPENIFLVDRAAAGPEADDFVRVVDFGPAEALFADDSQATRAGRVLGRPEYISPEQAAGRGTDARSDLYSLGVVAYEMLAGRRPFTGASMLDVAVMHLRSAVPPLPDALPAALRDLVGRALEKDPASRFSSADEMVRACDDVLAGLGAAPREPVLAPPASGGPGAGQPPDGLRAPIETIPIDTHWLGADPDEAGLVHWTTRFPAAPAVHQTGTLEIGRTYLVETALETAGDQLAAAAARAALLPDGAAVRFSVTPPAATSSSRAAPRLRSASSCAATWPARRGSSSAFASATR
jgi:hypothetical protein